MADTNSPIIRHENGNIEIKLVITWANLEQAYEKEVVKAVENAEIDGFRKGKAPRNVVEPKLDKTQLYSHAVQHLLPEVYAKVVKDHDIKPILYPQIRLDKGEEKQDWEFTALTCEAPKVELEDVKAAVSKVEKEPEDSKLTRIVEALREHAKVRIPDMLVEEEANHRVTSLVDNITKLGITTENYLQTKKLTPEEFRAQIASQARTDLEVEFILAHVQSSQKLTDRKETLDFLTNLV